MDWGIIQTRNEKGVNEMLVMPVSTANAGCRVNNNTNFLGNNNRNLNSNQEEAPVENNLQSSKLAKVPVIVMLAMTPSMLNAKTPLKGIPEIEGAKTEMIATLPAPAKELDKMTAAPNFEAPEVQQSPVVHPLAAKMFPGDRVLEFDEFNYKGKKQYMAFIAHPNHEKYVFEIFIVPEDYKPNAGMYKPEVSELVYHELGKGKDFAGVILVKTTNLGPSKWQEYAEEIRLPNECAQKIIDLLANDSKWTNDTYVKYSDTTSPNLRAPKTTIIGH